MAYIAGFGYLNNPYIIFNDANGKPLTNGTVETYIAGTTTTYNTLKDWNGTYNGAIITLDIYGGCTIIAPETQGLKLIVKTSTGSVYKTFDNVFIGGSNQGYLPGTTVIRVDGTDGEIISEGVPDPSDPDKLIFTISLDPSITDAITRNTDDIDGLQIHVGTIENNITVINDTLDTLIAGDKGARSFPLSLTETHYLKICDVTTDGTIPYHIDFLLYLSKNQLSLKFDEDVQGLMGTGTGSFKYLGQSCNPVFVYDVTPNTGRIVIFRTTPSSGKVSFFLVSYNGYELTNETVSIIYGHISGTTAVYSNDVYTTVAPTMASNSETIYLTHNIRVGTSCTGLGTYYSPIEAKATQVVSTNESIGIETTVTNGVTTHDLSVTGGQVDTYKVKTSSADAVPGFTYDKIIVEGILTKNKAASDTFGEVLQLAALVETDGETCSGNGTTNSPIVVFRDVSDNQNTWYLDTVNGLDTNSGLSRSAPKKTGDAVVIACKTAGKSSGRLVVMAGSSGVVFTAANWANSIFPFIMVLDENGYSGFTWNGVSKNLILQLIGGRHVFNSCEMNTHSVISAVSFEANGGIWNTDEGCILNISGSAIFNGLTSRAGINGVGFKCSCGQFTVPSAFMISGKAKIECSDLIGDGAIYPDTNYGANISVETERYTLSNGFYFPSQVSATFIKLTVSAFTKATGRLFYLGAESGIPVKYEIIVDTLNDVVPITIGNPAGTVAGKVIELLKYEDKVTSEIARATAAEALKADLVGGKVPTAQLPSYIDDVLDAYVVGSTPFASDWLSLTVGGSALTPESGKIYIVLTAGTYEMLEFRWSGTVYAEISKSLALGETSSTAYRGDRGKTAYDHSQITGNAHGLTKADLSLGNVDNVSDANKPVSTAQQTALDLKANKLTTVNNSTSTDYTFAAADILTIHVVNSATAATRTVPSDATAPTISIGDSIEIVQLGTGQVTLVADTGVTILTSLTLKTYGQNSVIEIRKIAASTWLCVGERAGS